MATLATGLQVCKPGYQIIESRFRFSRFQSLEILDARFCQLLAARFQTRFCQLLAASCQLDQTRFCQIRFWSSSGFAWLHPSPVPFRWKWAPAASTQSHQARGPHTHTGTLKALTALTDQPRPRQQTKTDKLITVNRPHGQWPQDHAIGHRTTRSARKSLGHWKI